MSLIHIDTYQVRQMGTSIQYSAQDLWEVVYMLRMLVERLDMNWQGGASQEQLLQDFRRLLHQLQANVQMLDDMGVLAHREANRWEESDQTWATRYSGMMPMFHVLPYYPEPEHFDPSTIKSAGDL